MVSTAYLLLPYSRFSRPGHYYISLLNVTSEVEFVMFYECLKGVYISQGHDVHVCLIQSIPLSILQGLQDLNKTDDLQ
jgi:hypothetical protein